MNQKLREDFLPENVPVTIKNELNWSVNWTLGLWCQLYE